MLENDRRSRRGRRGRGAERMDKSRVSDIDKAKVNWNRKFSRK
jgi:hypothetical protein